MLDSQFLFLGASAVLRSPIQRQGSTESRPTGGTRRCREALQVYRPSRKAGASLSDFRLEI